MTIQKRNFLFLLFLNHILSSSKTITSEKFRVGTLTVLLQWFFLILPEMYNACDCVKLVLKLRNFFCLKLSLYIYLQYTLHTCSYVCTSRESLNVSSELCNMCLHFSKPPLVKASCLLFYSNYVLVYMYMTLLDMCRGISFGFV